LSKKSSVQGFLKADDGQTTQEVSIVIHYDSKNLNYTENLKVYAFNPSLGGELTPISGDSKETFSANKYPFDAVFDVTKTHGPIYSMSIMNNADNKPEDASYIELEDRVQKLFDVGPEIQTKGIYPKSFRKIQTFNHKYVLAMGDRDDSSPADPRATILISDRNTFQGVTPSPDFVYTSCSDFGMIPQSTSDTAYVMVSLCDTENVTSRLVLFQGTALESTISNPGNWNNLPLTDSYDKMELLKIDDNTTMLFLRRKSDKTLESYVLGIGTINLVKFYHFAIERTELTWDNVQSFSVAHFNTTEGSQTGIINVHRTTDKQFTKAHEFSLSTDPTKVQIIQSFTLNDDLSSSSSLGQAAAINGFLVNGEKCYTGALDDSTKYHTVRCV